MKVYVANMLGGFTGDGRKKVLEADEFYVELVGGNGTSLILFVNHTAKKGHMLSVRHMNKHGECKMVSYGFINETVFTMPKSDRQRLNIMRQALRDLLSHFEAALGSVSMPSWLPKCSCGKHKLKGWRNKTCADVQATINRLRGMIQL